MSCRAEWGSVVANSYGGFIFHEKLGSPRVHNIVHPEFTISANIEKSKWPFFILIYIHIFICDILNRSEEVHPQFVFIFDKWEFRKPTAMHQQSRWIKRISKDLIFGKEATQKYKISRSNFDIQTATMSHHVQFQFVWSLFQCGAYDSFFFCWPERIFKDLKLLIKYRDIPGLPASLLAIVQHWLLV